MPQGLARLLVIVVAVIGPPAGGGAGGGRAGQRAAQQFAPALPRQAQQAPHIWRQRFRIEHRLHAQQATALDLHHHGMGQDALRIGNAQGKG